MGVVKKKPPKNKFPGDSQVFPSARQLWPTYNVESDQLNGLVAWWPNGSRGNQGQLVDVIGGYDLPMQGSSNDPAWVTDPEFGPVLNFETSSSQFIHLQQTPITTRPVTLTSWFKLESVQTGRIISITDASQPDRWWWLNSNGFQERSDAVSQTVNHTSTAVVGTWHLGVGIAVDATERHNYFDGGNLGSGSTSIGNPAGLDRITLGRLGDSTPSAYFDGLVGDTRIYNRKLSSAEVAAHYHPDTRFELYEVPRRIYFISGGGIGYFQSNAGVLTSDGNLVKQTQTTRAGALTFAGALATVKGQFANLAGALTFAGAVTKKTSTSLAGALTFVGNAGRRITAALAGALTFVGTLGTARIFVQAIAGALTFAGAATKQAGKILAGALTFVGALTARSKVTYNINSGSKIHGVHGSWKRIAKRKNSDGTIDFSDWAIHTWEIPVITMSNFEELRLQQGKQLTTLQTNDIDDINFGKIYSSAFIEGVVNGGQLGLVVMSVKITFRVDVTS
jgi:hypothetical protein